MSHNWQRQSDVRSDAPDSPNASPYTVVEAYTKPRLLVLAVSETMTGDQTGGTEGDVQAMKFAPS